MALKTDPYCFACGKQCDSLAGDPSRWPVHLGNDHDAHIGCVNQAFRNLQAIGEVLSKHGKVVNMADFAVTIDHLLVA